MWLLRDAGEHAAGVDAELVVLAVVEEDGSRGTLDRSIGRGSEDFDSIEDLVAETESITADLAADALADIDVEYEVIGKISKVAAGILETAENEDCNHIYIVGKQRSPTGKVIFSDVAQSVLLDFDGPVTVLIEES
jgi:nucleotide-binding universal stress UspA family protein